MEALGGERRYSSYSFTTSALDGDEWSASRPGRALPPEKGPPVPIGQEAGWAPEPVWTQRLEEKSFAPAGDWTPIARPSAPITQSLHKHTHINLGLNIGHSWTNFLAPEHTFFWSAELMASSTIKGRYEGVRGIARDLWSRPLFA
jgi:hypothetical protein